MILKLILIVDDDYVAMQEMVIVNRKQRSNNFVNYNKHLQPKQKIRQQKLLRGAQKIKVDRDDDGFIFPLANES